MFKKLIRLLIVFLPVIAVFLWGYPVNKINAPSTNISARCYPVEDFSKYRQCFSTKPKIKGFEIVRLVIQKAGAYTPLFAPLWLLTIVTFTLLATLVVWVW